MSYTEKITGELRALTVGVERAQGLIAAADSQAEAVAIRAAGTGFAAVAAGMMRVRSAIVAIQGRAGGLATLIGEVTKVVGSVPHGATPEEAIGGLTPAQNMIDGLRDGIGGVIAQVGETQRIISAVLHGGQPEPLLQALENAKQVLVLVAQRAGVTRQLVEAGIAEARQLGSSGN
ncbi:DUF6244 family protein [Micromonospora sp. NPDC003197]